MTCLIISRILASCSRVADILRWRRRNVIVRSKRCSSCGLGTRWLRLLELYVVAKTEIFPNCLHHRQYSPNQFQPVVQEKLTRERCRRYWWRLNASEWWCYQRLWYSVQQHWYRFRQISECQAGVYHPHVASVEPSSRIAVRGSDLRTRRECFERLVANPTGETEFLEVQSRYQVFGEEMVGVQYRLRHNISRVIERRLCQETGDLHHPIEVALGGYSSSA